MKIAFWGEIAPHKVTQNMYMMAQLFLIYEPSARIHIFRKRQEMEQNRSNFRLPKNFVSEKRRYQEFGMELSFYDCGNRLDTGTRRQIKEAGLVVVNMSQRSKEWDNFGTGYPFPRENALYLIADYFDGNPINRKAIEKNYRVDAGKIGIIPYNNEFYYAVKQGKISDFLHRGVWQSEKNKMLREELERTLFLFFKELQSKTVDEKRRDRLWNR